MPLPEVDATIGALRTGPIAPSRRIHRSMTTLVQMLTAFGALGGCVVAIVRLHRHYSIKSKQLDSMQDLLERRERAIHTLLGRYRATHRRLLRQLEQAEIYFDIEEELAERLATAQGGKTITKKSLARSAVMDRRRGDVELLTRVTTPSGIRDLKHRADELMVETMDVDLPGLIDSHSLAAERTGHATTAGTTNPSLQ